MAVTYELVAYLHLLGYRRLGQLIYSPTFLLIHESILSGYMADDLEDRNFEYPQGSGNILQTGKNLFFQLGFARLDLEHLANRIPPAFKRVKAICKVHA